LAIRIGLRLKTMYWVGVGKISKGSKNSVPSPKPYKYFINSLPEETISLHFAICKSTVLVLIAYQIGTCYFASFFRLLQLATLVALDA
jgi:hypothetical protein